MRHFCFYAVLLCLLLSCTRSDPATSGKTSASINTIEEVPASPATPSQVMPLAILQAGEFPLWFQFTDSGPVVIESIQDAYFTTALAPWPHARHVRFMLAEGENVLMAVNSDGFLRFSPRRGEGLIGLHRFSGGEFWRNYTVGAFAFLDKKPTALLYRDERFLDSGAPLPSPRLWTFDLYSSELKPQPVPLLDTFSPEDGWDIDALRQGGDGFWYFRATKKIAAQPELKMLRSGDLVQGSEQVSLGTFQSAALPEPLSAAPALLGKMLSAIFAENNCGMAAVVSPEFQTMRSFAADREKAAVWGFYSRSAGKTFLLAAFPQGNALYAETSPASAVIIRHFSLPPLPEGFVYTGIAMCGQTIVASWEDQDEYSIGAAGFMVVNIPSL